MRQPNMQNFSLEVNLHILNNKKVQNLKVGAVEAWEQRNLYKWEKRRKHKEVDLPCEVEISTPTKL